MKFEDFVFVLSEKNILLGDKHLQHIRTESKSESSELIDYKVALRMIDINLEIDEPLAKEWIVRKNGYVSQVGSRTYISTCIGGQ